MVMGTVGQSVARVYDEARARPLYLVRETRGLTGSGPAIGEERARGDGAPPVTAP